MWLTQRANAFKTYFVFLADQHKVAVDELISVQIKSVLPEVILKAIRTSSNPRELLMRLPSSCLPSFQILLAPYEIVMTSFDTWYPGDLSHAHYEMNFMAIPKHETIPSKQSS